MATIPPITVMFGDEQSDETATASNVFDFPRDVQARRRVRMAQQMVDRMENDVATCDTRSGNLEERMRASIAPPMLDHWRSELRIAEAQLALFEADDAMTWRGQCYRATRSAFGAN